MKYIKVRAIVGMRTETAAVKRGASCRGYVNTSAVKSAISFIDGDKGILRYRGYPIEQLAEKSHFTEVLDVECLFL